jgi:hypothetical protein
MKPDRLCPHCGSDDIMKNGTMRRGKQNDKCRDCGRQFVEKPQWKPKAQETFALMARMLLERLPFWQSVRMERWYGGRDYTVELTSQTVVWYHIGLLPVPIRWVLVKDPQGKFEPSPTLAGGSHV